MTAWRVAWVGLLAAGFGCSGGSVAGDDCGAPCAAGSVCSEGECRTLCQVDADCERGEICTDSLCLPGARTDAPRIDGIDANGTPDVDGTHVGHRYDGQLFITGQHLAGASVTLSDGAQAWPLIVCESSDTAVAAALPPEFPNGSDNYVLTATNQAGSCEATLPILQGEVGPTGPTGALDTAQVDAMNAAIAAAVPVGTIVPFAGGSSELPSGWAMCDGAAVERTGTYAALFAVVGITYGTGDGVNTFNLPNLTGRLPLATGGGHALASTGGAETHTLGLAEMPSHDHGGQSGAMNNGGFITSDWLEYGCVGTEGGFSRSNAVGCGNNHLSEHIHSIPAAGSGAAFGIMPPFLALSYIIKY